MSQRPLHAGNCLLIPGTVGGHCPTHTYVRLSRYLHALQALRVQRRHSLYLHLINAHSPQLQTVLLEAVHLELHCESLHIRRRRHRRLVVPPLLRARDLRKHRRRRTVPTGGLLRSPAPQKHRQLRRLALHPQAYLVSRRRWEAVVLRLRTGPVDQCIGACVAVGAPLQNRPTGVVLTLPNTGSKGLKTSDYEVHTLATVALLQRTPLRNRAVSSPADRPAVLNLLAVPVIRDILGDRNTDRQHARKQQYARHGYENPWPQRTHLLTTKQPDLRCVSPACFTQRHSLGADSRGATRGLRSSAGTRGHHSAGSAVTPPVPTPEATLHPRLRSAPGV